MFQSIQSAGTGPVVYPYVDWTQYKYIIVDDDFTEEVIGPSKQTLFQTIVRPTAVIILYEKRGLDVAYNLFRYHRFMEKFPWYNLQNELQYNKDNIPRYDIYLPQIESLYQRYNNLKAFW